MKLTKEQIETIVVAIETVGYGRVIISLAEKGGFIEVVVENKLRLDKVSENFRQD